LTTMTTQNRLRAFAFREPVVAAVGSELVVWNRGEGDVRGEGGSDGWEGWWGEGWEVGVDKLDEERGGMWLARISLLHWTERRGRRRTSFWEETKALVSWAKGSSRWLER
jgi:hypothetical protein